MGFLGWFSSTQLNRIESTLKRMEKRMSTQEQALDSALAALSTTVDAILAAVRAVLDKLAGIEGVDLTDETAALEGLASSLQEGADALNEAVNPPTP